MFSEMHEVWRLWFYSGVYLFISRVRITFKGTSQDVPFSLFLFWDIRANKKDDFCIRLQDHNYNRLFWISKWWKNVFLHTFLFRREIKELSASTRILIKICCTSNSGSTRMTQEEKGHRILHPSVADLGPQILLVILV